MAQIRIRERNQITLPATIAVAASLSPNDILEVSFANGVITDTGAVRNRKALAGTRDS